MEFLLQVIVYAICAFIAYKTAKKVKDMNPGFEIRPELYAVGAVLFGFIWVLLFLAIKYAIWNNKNK